MVTFRITKNEENQRLDRFLKKYYRNAPLSLIYRMIRKDVKVNGKRATIETILNEDDQVVVYIDDEQSESLSRAPKTMKAKKQFKIAYEDDNVLIVEKPFGLLTHGDASEKKNTLANQVCGYLAETGKYNPAAERTFAPSPVNRLDRNTTGLVIFGKTGAALQALNKMIREKGYVNKYYLTVVNGELKKELVLKDRMEKNQRENVVRVLPVDGEGKLMETIARPLMTKNGYSLVEVELVTGRTHQIRAHLAKAGYPVIGDNKYGRVADNRRTEKALGLTTQFLHAYKLHFANAIPPLENLGGKEIVAALTPELERIKSKIFD